MKLGVWPLKECVMNVGVEPIVGIAMLGVDSPLSTFVEMY